MASNIKFKRSAVQNRVPTTAQLDLGELALNTYDGKLYTEINTGSAAVVEIGSKLSSLVVDGANGAGGGDVTFHGTTAGRDLTWDYSANSLIFNDNAKAVFGSGTDLLIYHDGSNSVIRSGGTGQLQIESSNNTNIVMGNAALSETIFKGIVNGAVELYHNNLLRVTTTADGADIGGTGSLKVPVGTTAQRNASPAAGDIRYNSTLGSFEGYSSSWGELGGGGVGIGSTSTNPSSGVVGNRIGVGFTDINIVGTGVSVTGYGTTIVIDFNDFKPGSFHRTIHNYTATAGQTTFTGLNYDNSTKQIAVYLNGARLSADTYTATSGTTVVLDVGASVGDEVEIINIHINSDVDRKVNTYTATAGQTTFTGLSYNSRQELDVYLNGIRLATADYTANNGSTVVLAVGASVNDIVDIVSTGDGVTFRSTSDASGDRFTFNNVGIQTDATPDALNVGGNVNIVGVLTATTLHGDGSNLTNTGSTLSEPSSGTQRLVTTSLTTGTMTSSGTGSELAFDYANNHLEFSDNTKATFGTSNDLQIYHDGSHSYIDDTGTGNLKLRSNNFRVSNADESKLSATFIPSGAVELYHNNSKKFETTSTGASVTGNLAVSGVLTYDDVTNVDSVGIITARAGVNITGGNITLGDSGGTTDDRIVLGAGSDLQIFHNGTNSFVENSTGYIQVNSTTGVYIKTGNEHAIDAVINDAVKLYYDGSKKFETTSTGVTVTSNGSQNGLSLVHSNGNTSAILRHVGTGDEGEFHLKDGGSTLLYLSGASGGDSNITTGGNFDLEHDSAKLRLGAGNDLRIFHDGSHSIINNITGSFQVQDAGTEKFRVSGTGTFFKDDITLSNDNDKINIGAGNDLQIYHDGTNDRIDSSGTFLILEANNHIFRNPAGNEDYAKFLGNGAVELYHNNSKKFETTSTGASVTGTLNAGGLRITDDGASGPIASIMADDGNPWALQIGNSSYSTSLSSGHQFFVASGGNAFHEVRSSASGYNDYILRLNNSGNTVKNGIKIDGSDQSVILYAGGSEKLQTTSTGATLLGELSATGANFTDDGQSSPIVSIMADDGNPWALQVGNSTYNSSTAIGYQVYVNNNGEGYQYHIGSGAYKDFHFYQHNQSTSKLMIKFEADDNSVELYHDGTKRFETTSGGAEVTGRLMTDGVFVGDGGNNDISVSIGANNDLRLYHDGSNSHILDRGTGSLLIKSDAVNLGSESGEYYFRGFENGAVQLRYDNSTKLSTTSQGIEVTSNGTVVASVVKSTGSARADVRILAEGTGEAYLWMDASNGDLSGADYAFIQHRNSDLDLIIANYANDVIIKNRNGSVGAGGLNTAIHCHENGAVDLYHDTTKKFETKSNGASVTSSGDAHLTVTCSGHANLNLTSTGGTDHCSVNFGDSSDINAGMIQYTNSTNIMQFHTNGGERFRVDASGHVLPSTSNDYDLGSTSKRWRNIYTNDLNLSNEGGANEVDGTWGNYTIQEGESDLFLINKRNGKKYKFALMEVS